MKGLDVSKIMSGSKYKYKDETMTWETTNNPQGKVDVRIGLDNTILNASVKNYDFNNLNPAINQSINLVTGTNFLYLLSNRARFLNNYLNQTASTSPSGVIT